MSKRLGVWLVGAHGNVAVCAVAGARALARGLLEDDAGMVTAGPEFEGLDLAAPGDLVFGGHEVRTTTSAEVLESFDARNGLFPADLRRRIARDMASYDGEVRPGVLFGAGASVRAEAGRGALNGSTALRPAVERIRKDIRSFMKRRRLDRCVVVNVASTEAWTKPLPKCLRSEEAFEKALDSGVVAAVPASVLYAWAAVDLGLPFVNFTPSPACGVPAVRQRALRRGVPHMGRDGKTGETLLKTVLAPMFVARRLRVLSWEGYNMLGNRDGRVLDDPDARAGKVADKDQALRRILRDPDTHTRVRIDYVPSLDDWKTAFDFVHFRGFLGARMTLTFTWQGCDSALAAPLVLDLARLADLAERRGESGPMTFLASFFKSPHDCDEQDFQRQHALLLDWVARARVATAG